MKFRKPLSKKHNSLLNRALELSKLSTYSKFKHGAIIVKGGHTIAVGVNRLTNHPDHVEDPKVQSSVHAEIAALNACRKTDLNGASIYVARIYKSGEPAMSKPCENCQKALRERGIKKVYYTIDSSMDL